MNIKKPLKNGLHAATSQFLIHSVAINAAGLACSSVAFAVGNLGNVGTSLDTNTQGFSTGVSSILYFMGFAGAGTGVWKIMQARKQQGQGMGEGIGLTVGGAVLASLPELVGTLSSTTFGSDASTGGLNRLDVN